MSDRYHVACRFKDGHKGTYEVTENSEPLTQETAEDLVREHVGIDRIAVMLTGLPSTGCSTCRLGEDAYNKRTSK